MSSRSLLCCSSSSPPAATSPISGGSDPRAIVREAERAVANGRVPALSGRWSATLAQHPGNPAALFAQATIERLTYHYDEANRDYDHLRALSASDGGRFRAFSALGEAEMFFIAARETDAGSASGAALGIARESRDSSAQVLALVNLGILRLRSASPEVALATFDSAMRVLPSRDLELRARIRCGRASVLARTAREEAVTEAKAGARLARQAGARESSRTACMSPPAATSGSAACTRPTVSSTRPLRSRARSATVASSRRFYSGEATPRSSANSSIPRSDCSAKRSSRARQPGASRHSHGRHSISPRCRSRSMIRSRPRRT